MDQVNNTWFDWSVLKGISGKTGRYDEPFNVTQWEVIVPPTRYPLKILNLNLIKPLDVNTSLQIRQNREMLHVIM